MLIDTHCHIYLDEFDTDRTEMLVRAENEGVGLFLMPAIDSQNYAIMIDLEEQFTGKCLAMMGLHPGSVKQDFEKELKIAREWFEKRSFVAVGEIGLDFYWDKTFTSQQYTTFHSQIEWALEFDIPIVIHSRNAIDECISVVKEHQAGKLKGVFHCFSGSVDQANQIIELGLLLGIGGVVTFKNSGLDNVMKEVDLKYVVLETDSPYLAPAPFRGKRNECSYLKYVVEKLSELKEIPKKDVEDITTKNARELFSL